MAGIGIWTSRAGNEFAVAVDPIESGNRIPGDGDHHVPMCSACAAFHEARQKEREHA